MRTLSLRSDGRWRFVFGTILLLLSAAFCRADPTNCIPLPSGLVSWWPAEGTATDVADGNDGTLVGNTTYAVGKVGMAFAFDGSQDGVEIGMATSLQLQDFSIEAWVKRADSSIVSFDGNGNGHFFTMGTAGGGFGFYLRADGHLVFGKSQVEVSSSAQVTNTSWHHVAVAKSGTAVVFYVDGTAYPAPAFNSGGFTFAAPGYIGAWIFEGALQNSFYGMIDELAVYARALTAAEVQAVYQAGDFGKCVTPAAPVILVQPTNRTVSVNQNATFEVIALGTPPLAFQWSFNGANLADATNSALTVVSAQPTNEGNYAVVVTNPYGSVQSSNAWLAVHSPVCVPPLAGLISWWRGDGTTNDAVTGNDGTFAGGTVFGPGRVGQGFVFDGDGDGVVVGNPPSLQLQSFTIETWVKRASASAVSLYGSQNDAGLFAYGSGGYGLGLLNDGSLYLTKVGVNSVSVVAGVTNTDWRHVAVTKAGTNVVFYVDGVAFPAPAYGSVFNFNTSAALGAGGTLTYSFLGSIDEMSIYSRALSAGEIQAIYGASTVGKCMLAVPPVIVAHPRSTNGIAGGSVALSVVAGGSAPLSYRWRFNETNIANATSSILTLTNLQFSSNGNYSVQVSNVAGASVSSNATLTVVLPTPVLRALSATAMAGAPVTVPITVAANGNENTLGFSLNFSTQRLAFASAAWSSGVAGAALLLNTSQTGQGRLGIGVSFPAGAAFTVGTQEVVRINFNSLPLLGSSAINTTNTFGDQPLVREMYDFQLQALSANYSSGTVTLLPTVFEADVFPRTNGNQAVTTTDWAQVGRFAARLDTPPPGAEFQRADCAPRPTSGDGQIKVTDWVQAGRYVAGLDPLAVVGGPTNEVAPTPPSPLSSRQVRVVSTNVIQGQNVVLSIALDAQGDENALGFTLAFNPAALSFGGVTLGSGAGGASLTANANQVGAGMLGVVLALPAGTSLSPGSKELVRVNFGTSPGGAGVSQLGLTDQLVTRCVSDLFAGELAANFVNGTVEINPAAPNPALTIAQAGTNVVLSWPLWAADFFLEELGGPNGLQGGWTNVPISLQTNGASVVVIRPVASESRFFRLHHP